MKDFCDRLSAKLSALLPTKEKRSSTETLKQNAWSAFVKARISSTTDLWSQVYASMGLSFEQPLLSQRVNRKIFQRLLVSHLRERLPETASVDHQKDVVSLSVDEENALRYAAGFVPFQLMKKMRRMTGHKFQRFLTCLSRMSLTDQSDLVDHD